MTINYIKNHMNNAFLLLVVIMCAIIGWVAQLMWVVSILFLFFTFVLTQPPRIDNHGVDAVLDRIEYYIKNHNDSALIEQYQLDSLLITNKLRFSSNKQRERYDSLGALTLQMELLSDSAIQDALYQLSYEESVVIINAGMPRTKESADPFRGVWYSYNRNKVENYRYINTYDSVYWVGRPDTTGSYSNSVKHKFSPGLMDKDESKRLSDFFLIHNALTQLSKNEWTPYIDYTNYRPKFSFVWFVVTIKRNGTHYLILYAPDYANKEFIDWLNNQLAGTVNTEYFYDIGHHWALYTLKDQSFFY